MPVEIESERLGHGSTDGTHEDASPSSFVTCPESGIDEPTTGPLYWEKRRAEWLKEPTEPQTHPREEDNLSGSKARARLEEMLAAPFAEEDDMIWSGTLNAIWRGLSRGDRLKKNLPLPIVIKILRGGWVRDGTWPSGMSVPNDDNGMAVPEPPSRTQQQWNSPTTSLPGKLIRLIGLG